MHITDQYGRELKTLRVSLTNACNLACVYCTSTDLKIQAKKLPTLSVDALARYVEEIYGVLDLQTLRITGGEPTLYPKLIEFVRLVSQLGIPNLKMTTNGHRLLPFIKPLAALGLDQINISLDATTEEAFNKIAHTRNIAPILNSIDAALAEGIKVKLNAVIIRGINDDQILPLLGFAHERNIPIRFLELMRMGPMFEASQFEKFFVSQAEILSVIQESHPLQALPRKKSATARYWQAAGSAKFGIIANESEPFCGDCDRLRLDSYGRIYGCLSNEQPIDLTQTKGDANALKEKLVEALSQKQDVKFVGSPVSMLNIGG